MKNNILGTFIGSVVGDALGAPLEFYRRDKLNITDMTTGGILNLRLGEWTDDTSMSICLAESLIQNDFDLEDQMKKYILWYKEGKYCTREECFDIGNATRFALEDYIQNGNYISQNLSSLSSGNGSIMRLSPISIIYNSNENSEGFLNLINFSRKSSITTHPNKTCQDACALLSLITNRALQGYKKEEIFDINFDLLKKLSFSDSKVIDIAINSKNILEKERNDISSSGYVIHSLEAAIWCFLKTDNFDDSVLRAANLGDDADTVASITGQISGAYYGLNSINPNWIDNLYHKDYIINLSEKLFLKSSKTN